MDSANCLFHNNDLRNAFVSFWLHVYRPLAHSRALTVKYLSLLTNVLTFQTDINCQSISWLKTSTLLMQHQYFFVTVTVIRPRFVNAVQCATADALTKPNVDGSIVFARCRQCAFPIIQWFRWAHKCLQCPQVAS